MMTERERRRRMTIKRENKEMREKSQARRGGSSTGMMEHIPSAESLQSSQLVQATWERSYVEHEYSNPIDSTQVLAHLCLHGLHNWVWYPLHLGI